MAATLLEPAPPRQLEEGALSDAEAVVLGLVVVVWVSGLLWLLRR